MDHFSPSDEPGDAVGSKQEFRLYVSAVSPRSSRAVVNARKFFETHFAGSHVLEVLDIADNVETARADQVIASPTLIRMAPLPRRRFVGDMSDTESLRLALGLKKAAPRS